MSFQIVEISIIMFIDIHGGLFYNEKQELM